MTRKLTVTLTAAVLAAVLVIGMYTSLHAQSNTAGTANAADRSLTRVLTGTYRINLDVGAGTNRLDQITRIEFHEQYVVVNDYRGSGRVIPVSQIRQFTWDPM